MSEVKRYDAVHLRYEDSNIRYGYGCEVEVVAAYDYARLEQECEALKGLYRMHKETESREAIELKQKVDDLSMLVRQLVQALRKAAPDHALPAKALDYLQRKGLQGSPLRIGDDL